MKPTYAVSLDDNARYTMRKISVKALLLCRCWPICVTVRYKCKFQETKKAGLVMMKRPPFLSDFAQMASGAASAFGGVRGEMDLAIQSQLERLLAKNGLVTREDFEAAEARIAALSARIATLESQLAAMQDAPQAKKKAVAKKAPAKKA